MALPLRQHTVKTTYFFVSGYLFLPLFTSIREDVFSDTRGANSTFSRKFSVASATLVHNS
ncbi:MAG: hypothetical protein AVDCRST_MAG93-5260 [uncultured Chloroflexia bacterium]|uniref:Uncharacterized protein n=1 Tax=uncultured Chloroflexia bacterium TaxID=1672391 RepID=A0A6J4KR21_9CHLR|nr:MAG: hypothetical protein AVDCRST_MAG93-5260 [uncultured Chloroflexia bacterium]